MTVDLVVLQWIQEANLALDGKLKNKDRFTNLKFLFLWFFKNFYHDQLSVSAVFVVHALICLVKPNLNVNVDADVVVSQLVKFQW